MRNPLSDVDKKKIILRWKEKTPQYIYELTISRIEQAIQLLAVCGTNEQIRAAELRLIEMQAILINAEATRKGYTREKVKNS